MPTEDLSKVTDAVTVPSASESTPPATGTELPIINRAVLAVSVSAEELTAVCMPKIPAKTVEIKAVIPMTFLHNLRWRGIKRGKKRGGRLDL